MKLTEQQLTLIKQHQPKTKTVTTPTRAAVAIILREGECGDEFLMMQRAFDERDPWSGQMAFPGGKIDPEDNSAKAAAVREVLEEVEIKLTATDYVGQLDDCFGIKVNGQYQVHVSCFVFKPKKALSPKGNYEVAGLVWVPLSTLNDSSRKQWITHPRDEGIKFLAVDLNAEKQQVIWGLSLRMILSFYELIQLPTDMFNQDELTELKDLEHRGIKRGNLNG